MVVNKKGKTFFFSCHCIFTYLSQPKPHTWYLVGGAVMSAFY